jgi:hypothetical protein
MKTGVPSVSNFTKDELFEAMRGLWDGKAEDQLREIYGAWGDCPHYPDKDWLYEVGNGDTRLSYWGWVAHQMEMERNEL